MIQESINQLITTAGIATRLSPNYEKRQEAKDIIGKAKSATGIKDGKKYGLAEIEENLRNPKKQYGSTELRDIENRVRDLNSSVYSAKVINTPGHPLYRAAQMFGVDELPKQQDYHKMLSSIEGSLDMRRKALESMREKAMNGVKQNDIFEENRDNVMNKKQYISPELTQTPEKKQYTPPQMSFDEKSSKANTQVEEKKAIADEQKKTIDEIRNLNFGKAYNEALSEATNQIKTVRELVGEYSQVKADINRLNELKKKKNLTDEENKELKELPSKIYNYKYSARIPSEYGKFTNYEDTIKNYEKMIYHENEKSKNSEKYIDIMKKYYNPEDNNGKE